MNDADAEIGIRTLLAAVVLHALVSKDQPPAPVDAVRIALDYADTLMTAVETPK